MAVAGESPGMLMATTAADHAFLMAMVADIGGTNTNMDMETETDTDMAIAVGDFRGWPPLTVTHFAELATDQSVDDVAPPMPDRFVPVPRPAQGSPALLDRSGLPVALNDVSQ